MNLKTNIMENTNDKEKFELPTLWAYLKSDPSALLRILFPNSNGEFICRQLSDNKQVKCEYSKLEIISDLIKAAELEQEYDSKFNQEETEFFRQNYNHNLLEENKLD